MDRQPDIPVNIENSQVFENKALGPIPAGSAGPRRRESGAVMHLNEELITPQLCQVLTMVV